MKILFFDTETTGLPRNWKAPMKDLDNWPRVIQLAWIVCDDGIPTHEAELLIKPDGWKIPVEKFWIENGFSQEASEKDGDTIDFALDLFLHHHDQSDFMVSHNMSFDYNVLGSEMIRAKKQGNKYLKKLCTKEYGTDLCQLPGQYGYKWPKLSELHQFLFKEGFDGAHDALSDVKACMRCFYEMVNRGVISLS
jgi:DNA polymerase-3 subunit epsilon